LLTGTKQCLFQVEFVLTFLFLFSFVQYVSGLADYYREVARTTADMISYVQNIDRSAIQNHPPVITPAERSSATHASQAVVNTSPTMTTNSRSTVNLSGAGYQQPQQQADYYNQQQYQSTTTTTTTSYSAPVAAAPVGAGGRNLPTPPARGAAAPPGSRRARALFDFNAQEANELSFRYNEVINIVSMNGDWWEGELNGRRGLLPSNYVQLE
jgi:myosin-1